MTIILLYVTPVMFDFYECPKPSEFAIAYPVALAKQSINEGTRKVLAQKYKDQTIPELLVSTAQRTVNVLTRTFAGEFVYELFLSDSVKEALEKEDITLDGNLYCLIAKAIIDITSFNCSCSSDDDDNH